MYWKLKAHIQNVLSLLPPSISYASHYWIQRHFGGLRKMSPVSGLTAGIKTWKLIKKYGGNPSEKVFLEVGTGRVPIVPLAYWLMGAESTFTIDLNPYLKAELVRECLHYISDNNGEIQKLFKSLLYKKRLDDLLRFCKNASFSVEEFLDLCHIKYIAPGDAAKTGLASQCIDYHTSYTVFEHILPKVLRQIIEEGNRIIRDNGFFVHSIDYSDHFSHSDKKISLINFLQFSDAEMDKYAENRYMYSNRLRHDDFVNLFQSVGHRIIATELDINQQLTEVLRSGNFQLNERFKTKSEKVLATTGSWIVSQKSG